MSINNNQQLYAFTSSGELLIDYVDKVLEGLRPYKITGKVTFEINLERDSGSIKFSAKPYKSIIKEKK